MYGYTKEEEKFLLDNYSTLGPARCSKFINKQPPAITAKARRMGLFVPKENIIKNKLLNSRSDSKLSVNPTPFINVETPYHSYLLGFLWGDGYLDKKRRMISIHIAESDALLLDSTINQTGKWFRAINYSKITTHQNSVKYIISNKRLYNFLSEYNYEIKSICSHKKILDYIPNDYKYLWIRGLIDADGSFYCNKINNKNRFKGFCITSTYEQDWSYLLSFFQNLNINIKYRQRIIKSGKSSEIFFTKIEDFISLYNYIYPNTWDNVGLKRKHDKCLYILENFRGRY